jgi:carboxypeptidase C (cathepsin A)
MTFGGRHLSAVTVSEAEHFTVMHLRKIEIHGSTQFPMSDLNNVQIADQVRTFFQRRSWTNPALDPVTASSSGAPDAASLLGFASEYGDSRTQFKVRKEYRL